MPEPVDPRRGGAYLILNELFGPPMLCPSRERQVEVRNALARIRTWAAELEPVVREAYRWSIEDYLRVAEEALTQREAGEAARYYAETFPRPPL